MSHFCLTCKYWNAQGDGPELTDPVILNDETSHEEWMYKAPHRRCLLALHANHGPHGARAEVEAKPMLLLDGSGYSASLYTRVDFGCAAWEPHP